MYFDVIVPSFDPTTTSKRTSLLCQLVSDSTRTEIYLGIRDLFVFATRVDRGTPPEMKVTFLTWSFSSKNDLTAHSTLVDPTSVPCASLKRQLPSASQKRGKKPRSRPKIAERDSSLYPARVSDPSAAAPSSNPSPFPFRDTSTSINNLDHHAESHFPRPPPRFSLSLDRRHTDVWDDLFDWADACRFEEKAVLASSSSQIDLRVFDRSSRRSSRVDLTGKRGFTSHSEIWSMVSEPLYYPSEVVSRCFGVSRAGFPWLRTPSSSHSRLFSVKSLLSGSLGRCWKCIDTSSRLIHCCDHVVLSSLPP